MPNWEKPGSDYPSKEDTRQMERESNRREKRYKQEEDKVGAYLRNHPSASWAEAQYQSRNK